MESLVSVVRLGLHDCNLGIPRDLVLIVGRQVLNPSLPDLLIVYVCMFATLVVCECSTTYQYHFAQFQNTAYFVVAF